MSDIVITRPRLGGLAPLSLAVALIAGSASLARADGGSGGDRSPAGGAFMSSYSQNPYPRDPRAAPPKASAFAPLSTGSVDLPAAAARPARRGYHVR